MQISRGEISSTEFAELSESVLVRSASVSRNIIVSVVEDGSNDISNNTPNRDVNTDPTRNITPAVIDLKELGVTSNFYHVSVIL